MSCESVLSWVEKAELSADMRKEVKLSMVTTLPAPAGGCEGDGKGVFGGRHRRRRQRKGKRYRGGWYMIWSWG